LQAPLVRLVHLGNRLLVRLVLAAVMAFLESLGQSGQLVALAPHRP
jgi:hypothetical protein